LNCRILNIFYNLKHDVGVKSIGITNQLLLPRSIISYLIYERVYKLEDEEPDRDLTDFSSAMTKAMEFGSRIPIGLIYKIEKPTYEDTEPVLLNGPLVDQSLGIKKELFDQLLAVTM